MAKLALGWGEAQEISRLYWEEKNEFGRQKWTMSDLSERFGVGESTIFRVVNRKGPYKALRPPKSEMEIQIEAEQAFDRLSKLLEVEQRDTGAGESVLEAMLQRGKAQRDDPALSEKVEAARKVVNPLDEE